MSDKLEVKFEVERDTGFYDMLLSYNDLFMTSYCGYWAYGLPLGTGTGWLVYVDPESMQNQPLKDEEQAALAAYRAGTKLPEDWYLLDTAAVDHIVSVGIKRYGLKFQEEYDADSLDVALQIALLGEVTFG